MITVLGPASAGSVEVATFRQDVSYSDGRRPDEVRFSSPREDALRRDFTINGMFFDPTEERVIDYVDGQDDLASHLIRAIGEPQQRFAEDKLRMLRAVRFAAAFDFAIEDRTATAIREMSPQIKVVSAERIAAEMRMMLEATGRARAVDLLGEFGLLREILPEALVESGSHDAGCEDMSKERDQCRDEPDSWRTKLGWLSALDRPTFPQALAVLLGWPDGEKHITEIGGRWRLSNKEVERTGWLLRHSRSLDHASDQRWSQLQPTLAHEGAADLLELYRTAVGLGCKVQADVDFCRLKLALPPDKLRPAPLITGEDLIAMGVPKGQLYAKLLKFAREAQLDGVVHSAVEARELIREKWRLTGE